MSNLEMIFGNQAKTDIEKDLQPLPRMRDGYSMLKEPTECNVCEDVPTTEVPKVDRLGLTTGPVKTQIIRCPKCGSSNVYLGIKTIDGVPVLCRECGHFEPTKYQSKGE